MSKIVDQHGRPFPPALARRSESPRVAKIDAAQTTDENRRHWAAADSLSADAAYDPWTRLKLRNRARYETVNNSYAKASVNAAACDLIGTGPRLQLQIPRDAAGRKARTVERQFGDWADEIEFARNLRTAELSKKRDGEAFGIFDDRPELRHPVKLFLRWVEAEMCASGLFRAPEAVNEVDGIEFDRNGVPVRYTFLRAHPGGMNTATLSGRTYSLPASQVLHWFARDRFGQHRAIPEITPALPLYAQSRRWRLATLTSAEFASMVCGVLKTNHATAGAVTEIDDWSLFEMVRGALLTIPNQWDASQFKPEQPTANYGEFNRETLNEQGRAINQPLNVISGNSSGYNYSSGRLDHLPYHRSLRIERSDLRMIVLDPTLRTWEIQARGAGLLDDGIPPIGEWRWSWNFDGFDSIDAQKDAQTDDIRLRNGTATYAEVLAEYGQDWREVFEQIARERDYAASLGLSLTAPGAPAATPADNADQASDMEQVVQLAMEEAGIDEQQSAVVLDMLSATFTALARRKGAHRG